MSKPMKKFMASGDPVRDIIGWNKIMASGEPEQEIIGWQKTMASGDPVRDIIGDYVEYEIGTDGNFARDIEIGCSANADEIGLSFFKRIGRAFKTAERKTIGTVIKKAERVPGLGDAVKLGENVADIVTTPKRIAFGAASGLFSGGFKGAARGAKGAVMTTLREGRRLVQNPIVRYGTKGAALAFPPAAPAAAAVEAANQVIAAAEHKDPLKAALALTTIVNTASAANLGDEDAMRAIKTIKAVKDGSLPMSFLSRAKKAIKTPVKLTIPKNASKTAVVKTAHNLLSAAKSTGAQATRAMSVIKQTVAAAQQGDPNAIAASKVLAIVHKAQQKVLPPSVRALGKRTPGSFKKAMRAAKGKSFTGSYLVDSKGRVYKGNFAAK